MNLDKTISHIIKHLKAYKSVAIAYSGGVDSSLLAVLAQMALGAEAHIFTFSTPYMSEKEIEQAVAFAKKHHLHHQLIKIETPQNINNNPKDRCYLCKQQLFSRLITLAQERHISVVLDGSNADDVTDYRPGMKALKELNIKSPFLELGITKQKVRALSKHLKLETWDTPSNPCLLTRLPYDTPILAKAIRQVEAAEEFMKEKGFRIVRVRHEGQTARIEVPQEDQVKVLSLAEEVQLHFKSIGFTFTALDLKAFSSGNMNQTL